MARRGSINAMGFTVDTTLSTWRRLALSTWRRGDDPSVYGFLDVDATPLLDYVRRAREATGVHVTLTHLVGRAAAEAFKEHPDCNGVVSWGRLKRRDSVDVFFQVAADGGRSLSGAKVVAADKRTVVDIAKELDAQVARIRKRGDTELQKTQSRLKGVPGVLLGPVMRLSEMLTFDMELDLSKLGVPSDPFGTVMITNVGVFGIEQGLAPLMPLSRTPALLCVGAVHDAVIAVDGAPAVRPVVIIGATFDHRIIDGAHVGRLARVIRAILKDPTATLGPPEAQRT